MHDFQGVYAPVPTPFTDDSSSISEIRLARWLRRASEQGIHGFVVGGDAGEFASLTFAERKQLFDLALRSAPADASVLAHVSTLSTSACIDLTLHAASCGAKAAVVMPPYYGRFTDAELAGHFQSVAHHGRIPIIVVDPMGRIGFDLHEALSKIPELRIGASLALNNAEAEACFDKANSDEFTIGEAQCTPMAAMGSMADGDPKRALQRLFHDYGVARVLKSASEFGGCDLGPLRNPLRSLPAPAMEILKSTLREAA